MKNAIRPLSTILWALLTSILFVPLAMGDKPQDGDPQPAPIPLNKAMIDKGAVAGLSLAVAESAADTLRVRIVYARNPRDHLARAIIVHADADAPHLALPVKISTDGDGRDTLVFSASKDAAERLALKLIFLPRANADADVPARSYLLPLGSLALK